MASISRLRSDRGASMRSTNKVETASTSARRDDEHRARTRKAEEKPGERGADETRRGSRRCSSTAFAAVSSAGERASEGVSAACADRNGVVAIAVADCEAVDDHGVGVEEDAYRGRADEDEPHEVRRPAGLALDGSGRRACPAKGAISAAGTKRSKEQQPDRGLAADVVRVDGDGDDVRPVADDGARPCELEAPQLLVRKDAPRTRLPTPRFVAALPPRAGASHPNLRN